jgi:two-component system nitrate/nitrite response regulator NarL
MEKRVSTVIIEPRLLIREALELLMRNQSYRVVCGTASTADIASSSSIWDGPELVIMGAQAADNAAKDAEVIRARWPDSKIIFLFDDASAADFQNMLASQIDGCIPLFVSPDTLMSTLDLIIAQNARIVVMGDTKPALKCPEVELLQEESKTPRLRSNGPLIGTVLGVPPLERPSNEAKICDRESSTGQALVVESNSPALSEREIQILDGLVKGHANKVIARGCGVTEATVKVHMKSILRKIRACNRTQAAIWALEHGYAGDEHKATAVKTNEATEETNIVRSSPKARAAAAGAD